MGMECVRTTEPLNCWPPMGYKTWLRSDSLSIGGSPPADEILPHSAPGSSSLFDATLACRRAASFPVANAALLSSDVKARSQSESAALNALSLKVPHKLIHELKLYSPSPQRPSSSQSKTLGRVTFYAPLEDGIASDSEGEENFSPNDSSSSDNEDFEHPHHHHHHRHHHSAEGADLSEQIVSPTSDSAFSPLNFDQMGVNGSVSAPLLIVSTDLGGETSGATTAVDSNGVQLDEAASPTATESVDSAVGFDSDSNNVALGTISLIYDDSSANESVDTACDEPDSIDESSQQRAKRKAHVRFADECGNTLFCVRVITEPSDYPPEVPVQVLRRHRKAAGMEDVDDRPKLKSTWKMLFKQPASEYVKFRHNLEQQHVALENAILKNDVPKMVGTIKVANIAFEKRVFVRCTADHWATHEDHEAKFQVSASKAFDTFTFDIPLPCNVGVKDPHYEFCICYVANGTEYWDSNDGHNYVLGGENMPIQLHSPNAVKTPSSPSPHAVPAAKQRAMANDAYRMEYETWSKFASWKALSTDVPYW